MSNKVIGYNPKTGEEYISAQRTRDGGSVIVVNRDRERGHIKLTDFVRFDDPPKSYKKRIHLRRWGTEVSICGYVNGVWDLKFAPSKEAATCKSCLKGDLIYFSLTKGRV